MRTAHYFSCVKRSTFLLMTKNEPDFGIFAENEKNCSIRMGKKYCGVKNLRPADTICKHGPEGKIKREISVGD